MKKSIPYINQLVIMVILLTNHMDHASKIQERMGRESIVPASNVRYVSVNQLGKAFYIHDGDTEALFMLSLAMGVPYEYYDKMIYLGTN